MLQKIRELICIGAKFDHFPKTDREYEKISTLISVKSKRKTELHINTLKSVFDHWKRGTRELNESTKEAISDFLGFDDWNDLINNLDEIYNCSIQYNCLIRKRNVSLLGGCDLSTRIMSLDKGSEIVIRYSPDREIKARVIGNDRYKVVYSVNSSLIENDEITIKSFQIGLEFAAFDVKRYGEIKGDYIAASGHVITKVIICSE